MTIDQSPSPVIHAPTLEPVYLGVTNLVTWMSISMENTIYLWFMLIQNTLGFLSVACASGFQVCLQTPRQKVTKIQVCFSPFIYCVQKFSAFFFYLYNPFVKFFNRLEININFGFFDVHIEFLWNIFPGSCEHFLQTFEANRGQKGSKKSITAQHSVYK
jgi:hypothetical protein